VTFAKVRLQPQRDFSFCSRFRFPGFSWFVKMKNASAGRREPRVRQREIRIELYRFGI
jgi:hypothetical protein